MRRRRLHDSSVAGVKAAYSLTNGGAPGRRSTTGSGGSGSNAISSSSSIICE